MHQRFVGRQGFRWITDNDAVRTFMQERSAILELPSTPTKNMPVSLMFVADPDRIINELFGFNPDTPEQ